MRPEHYITLISAKEVKSLPVSVLYTEYRELNYKAIDALRAAKNLKAQAIDSLIFHAKQ